MMQQWVKYKEVNYYFPSMNGCVLLGVACRETSEPLFLFCIL